MLAAPLEFAPEDEPIPEAQPRQRRLAPERTQEMDRAARGSSIPLEETSAARHRRESRRGARPVRSET
jgi:hypothetical protein